MLKDQLQEIVKPYQQEQNRRQKKADFLKTCVKSIEKNDFFQLDELLNGKLAEEILKDPYFSFCHSLFNQIQEFSDNQIKNYQVQYKKTLLQMSEIKVFLDLRGFVIIHYILLNGH